MLGETSFFRKLLRIAITGLAAIPGGVLFSALGLPLPWMLGPLAVTLIHHTFSGQTLWPVHLRNAALVVIGYSMGRTVTAETAHQILINLPGMVAATLLIVLFSMGIGYLTHRHAGISLASGILGSVPGGMIQMILMAEEIRDADVASVTLMQVFRILAVLFIVPFIAAYGLAHLPAAPPVPLAAGSPAGLLAAWPVILAALMGAWLAVRLKVPIPFLMGPIFATIAAVLAGFPALAVPRPAIHAAQFSLGVYLGVAVSLNSLRGIGRLLLWSIGGSVALIAFAFLVGLGLTLVTPASLLTAFLGTAPGGIAEMGIVALALGTDVAFVLAYQLFRFFSILLVAPLILRRQFRR